MNNLLQMLQQFNQFKNTLTQTGKQPQQILNDLINSGKVTKEQLDQAKSMAEMFTKILGGK